MSSTVYRLAAASGSLEVQHMLRFGCVGLLGVVVNTALLWTLTEWMSLYYVISSALATEVAILSNFTLNHVWTFASLHDTEPVLSKLVKYNAVALGGLLITVSAVFLFTELLRLNYLLANLLAIGTSTAWNYGANRRWTWTARIAVNRGGH